MILSVNTFSMSTVCESSLHWACNLRNGMKFTLSERPNMAASVLSLWLDVDILGAVDAEERKEVDPKGEYWLLPDLGNDWYE